MKTRIEIEEAIEDTEKALEDLNDRGNLTSDFYIELNKKIDTLKWVIE